MSNFRKQTVYPEAGGWEEKEWRKVVDSEFKCWIQKVYVKVAMKQSLGC